jgi:NAD(P)-dependent dehydrogenase (short-subunit alcohol dehydrogenase family)
MTMNVLDQFSLKGKVALVTGSGGVIGATIAEGYLAAGADVVISDRDVEKIEPVVTRLADRGNVIGVAADVTDAGSLEAAVDTIVERFGKIDILCTAAGVAIRTPALELSAEEYDQVMAVNTKGTFLAAQAAARAMIANGGGGKIVTIGSVRGLVGHPLGYVSYGTSKGAVHLLTRQLATEWAEHRINVNAIAPSVVHTPIGAYILQDKAIRDLFMSRIPFNRAMQPEELVGTAVYLSSPASDFVTGQIIFVDGGSTAG